MPEYLVDINHIITLEEAKQMINRTKLQRDRFIVAILYLTGARPQEICYDKKKKDGLKKKDIFSKEGYIHIRLRTLKLGKGRKFRIEDRELEFPKDAPFIKYVLKWHKKTTSEFLLPLTTTRVWQIIHKLSDDRFCSYNFRHSRLAKLSREGASRDELMYWKGARDVRSVESYLHGKPIGRKLKIT